MSEQLCLFEADSDSDSVSLSNTDSDTDPKGLASASTKKQQAIQKYLDRAVDKETTACVSKYSPGKRKTEYYRLSYRVGLKMKHIHIKGGSTIAELANYRAKKLQAMIDRGAELSEVLAAVRTFNGASESIVNYFTTAIVGWKRFSN
ncbi:MAG: hypothetical protein ACRCZK_05890 [Oscillospiraceae bacterium]